MDTDKHGYEKVEKSFQHQFFICVHPCSSVVLFPSVCFQQYASHFPFRLCLLLADDFNAGRGVDG
jgi:hypothetical protein